MPRQLPRFELIGVEESRALWRKYRGNRDAVRMLLQIAHTQRIVTSLSNYFDVLRECWMQEDLGQLVAMEKMRLIFVDQRMRQGVLAGLKPPPRKDDPEEPEPSLVE